MPEATASPVGSARPTGGRADRHLTWWSELGAVTGTWVLGALVFFTTLQRNGLATLVGDDRDGRLIVYLNEHWYQVLLGRAPLGTEAFFAPFPHALGFSDTFVLYAAAYVPLRVVGISAFVALHLTLVALSAFGFATAYLFVRRIWRPPLSLGLLAAFLFTFASMLNSNAGHPQEMGLYFLPAVGLLGLSAWRRASDAHLHAALLAAGAGALWMAVLLSTYYVGYDSFLAAALFGLVALAYRPRWIAGQASRWLRAHWPVLLAGVAGVALVAVPFAAVYLPVQHSGRSLAYSMVALRQPTVGDLLDVGSHNLAWSWVTSKVAPVVGPGSGERNFALTPILAATLLLGTVVATRLERKRPTPGLHRFGAAIITTTTVLIALLPIRAPWGNPWKVLIYPLPGAQAMRANGRMGLLLVPFAAMALVAIAMRLRSSLAITAPNRRRWLLVATGVLAVLLCAEQLNYPVATRPTVTAEVAALNAVPAPPSSCERFYVLAALAQPSQAAAVQTEAMMLSARLALPTLNGYSGSTPRRWPLLHPFGVSYERAAYSWAARNHILSGLCRYDEASRHWTVVVPPAGALRSDRGAERRLFDEARELRSSAGGR